MAKGDDPGEAKDGAAASSDDGWRSEMRREYAAGLEAKLETLRSLVGALAGDPACAERRAALLDAVHKIRGSAGAYGFGELSHIAADWEAVLGEGAAIETLRGFIDRIDTAARAALARED